jgi:surface protein G
MDLDSDGDGVPDRTDSLRRNPCAPDRDALACPGGDADVVADPCVPDEDNLSCPSGDFDGDGVSNGDDGDAEDECVPNACDGPGPGPGVSPDGGMPMMPMPGERTEHDADGDGLSDEDECSDDDELQRRLARRVGGAVPEVDGCPDSDGDGLADRDDDDSDGDGLLDAEECRGGVPCPDRDRDGIPDVLDPGTVALVGGGCAVGGDPRDAAGSWLAILLATFALARKRRRPEQTL